MLTACVFVCISTGHLVKIVRFRLKFSLRIPHYKSLSKIDKTMGVIIGFQRAFSLLTVEIIFYRKRGDNNYCRTHHRNRNIFSLNILIISTHWTVCRWTLPRTWNEDYCQRFCSRNDHCFALAIVSEDWTFDSCEAQSVLGLRPLAYSTLKTKRIWCATPASTLHATPRILHVFREPPKWLTFSARSKWIGKPVMNFSVVLKMFCSYNAENVWSCLLSYLDSLRIHLVRLLKLNSKTKAVILEWEAETGRNRIRLWKVTSSQGCRTKIRGKWN